MLKMIGASISGLFLLSLSTFAMEQNDCPTTQEIENLFCEFNDNVVVVKRLINDTIEIHGSVWIVRKASAPSGGVSAPFKVNGPHADKKKCFYSVSGTVHGSASGGQIIIEKQN
jgi:hypothetical protein